MTKRESNIIKCVAIMLMLFHHLFMYAAEPDFPPLVYGPILRNQWLLASAGQLSKLCVTLFVFVTAYGTARSYGADNMENCGRLMEKSARRLARLLVNFQFVYIIAFILCPLGGKSWLTLYSPSPLENLAFAFFDFMGLSYILQTPSYNSAWWYMSFAITLVLLLPWLIKLCRRMGAYVLLPGLLLVRWLDVEFVLARYMLITLLGIVLAEYGVLERIKDFYLQSPIFRKAGVLLLCLGITGAVSVLWLRAGDNLLDIYEAMLCLPVVLLVLLIPGRIPYLRDATEFVGRHSMNMFFIHAFIYQNWFYDFTYSLKYPVLIYMFLFASSLAASVLIEQLKKGLKIGSLADRLSRMFIALLPKERERV